MTTEKQRNTLVLADIVYTHLILISELEMPKRRKEKKSWVIAGHVRPDHIHEASEHCSKYE